MLETQPKWYQPAWEVLGWHIGFWNVRITFGLPLITRMSRKTGFGSRKLSIYTPPNLSYDSTFPFNRQY